MREAKLTAKYNDLKSRASNNLGIYEIAEDEEKYNSISFITI